MGVRHDDSREIMICSICRRDERFFIAFDPGTNRRICDRCLAHELEERQKQRNELDEILTEANRTYEEVPGDAPSRENGRKPPENC